MCLIGIASGDDARPYRLVVAANRDEFHERPTAAAHFWPDAPEVLAGRDLRAGGTWMGVTRGGRFAALTNLRSPQPKPVDAPSRGALVSAFLRSDEPPAAWLDAVAADAARYAGFNLVCGLLAPSVELYYLDHRGERRRVGDGIRALSNAVLGTDWPKTRWLREGMHRLLAAAPRPPAPDAEDVLCARLLELVADETVPPDGELPDTGVGIELERRLAPAFIRGEVYGTRSSTLLLVRADGSLRYLERSFDRDGRPTGEQDHALTLR